MATRTPRRVKRGRDGAADALRAAGDEGPAPRQLGIGRIDIWSFSRSGLWARVWHINKIASQKFSFV